MRNHDGTTCKTLQGFFKRTQRVYVEVIRRLVKQENVRPLFKHLGQVHTIALTTRELRDLFLLITAAEVEA